MNFGLSHSYSILFSRAINERQRAILEDFAKEEIVHDSSTSGEGNWYLFCPICFC